MAPVVPAGDVFKVDARAVLPGVASMVLTRLAVVTPVNVESKMETADCGGVVVSITLSIYGTKKYE